ncbi:MAG: hypothetical protein ABII74_09610 [Elusimicrobiota bacterium]
MNGKKNQLPGQNGMAITSILFILVILLPILVIFIDIVKTQVFSNQKMQKISKAEYNAEAGVNEALSNLKWRIKQLETRVSDGVLLIDGTTDYISPDQLSEYIDQDCPAKFFTDYLNNFSGEPDFTVSSPSAPYASYMLSNNTNLNDNWTTEIRLNKTTEDGGCRWVSGFGNNDAWLVFKYEIITRGKSLAGGNEQDRLSSSKTVRVTGKRLIKIHLKRTLSKYQYFTSSGSYNGSPVWLYAALATPPRFNGPVYTNDYLYVKGNPGFSDKVSSAKNIYYYNNPPSSPSATTRAAISPGVYYDNPSFTGSAPAFTANAPVESLPSTLDKTQQILIATGGQTAYSAWDNGVYQSTTTPAVYIKGNADVTIQPITILNPGDGVRYIFSPGAGETFPAQTVDISVDDNQQFLVYVDGQISAISGILQENAQVTIAAENSIIFAGNLEYAGELASTVLGLISWTGDVLVSKDYSGDITVYASIMAPQGGVGVEDLAGATSYKGNFSINGGMIVDHPLPTLTSTYYGYSFSSIYDTALQNQKAPPYFPGNGKYELKDDTELVKDAYSF